MSQNDQSNDAVSRRDFLRLAGTGVATLGLGVAGGSATQAMAAPAAPAAAAGNGGTGPLNILFILTDQERFFRPGELPPGYHLPAHERLMKQGTTFVNHRINACVCTPSRSVL